MADVKTRVVIDANAQNAITEIGKLDTAAADADTALTELDGMPIDVDTTAAVASLAKLEEPVDVVLTADTSGIATAAGDVDALQADAGTTIHIPIDVDADRLDNVKRKLDDVGDSGRAGGTAIGGIGGSISELPGIGNLGPIAESLGQLTENALEGGESISGITKAIGILGGTAAVMYGIQTVMKSIADSKAFDKKKAEDFKKAIDDVGDGAQAVLEVIKETQSVTGHAGGLFGTRALDSAKDITEQLNAADISVRLFTAAVAEGGPALDTAVGKLEAMKTAAEEAFKADPLDQEKRQAILDYADAIEVLKETHKTYSDQVATDTSWDEWSTGGMSAMGAVQNLIPSVDELKAAQQEQADGAKNAADRADDLRDAFKDQKRATDDLKTANQLLRDEIANDQYLLDLKDTFRDVQVAGDEAWTAAADGALDAGIKMDDYKGKLNDAKIKVLEYKDSLGELPAAKVTEVSALIDKGSLDKAERQMEVLTRNRTMEVSVVQKGGIGFTRLDGTRI